MLSKFNCPTPANCDFEEDGISTLEGYLRGRGTHIRGADQEVCAPCATPSTKRDLSRRVCCKGDIVRNIFIYKHY